MGWSALTHAVRNGHHDAARMLIEAGAELSTEYTVEKVYMSTAVIEPLVIAARYADVEMVRLLVESGADFNAELNDAESLLHLAAMNDDPELVAYVIDQLGVDPNTVNEIGRTPLYFAAAWDPPLLPSATLEDRYVRDPERELERVLVLLELHAGGADINRFDNSGFTPLLYACMNGTTSQVRFLLQNGAELYDGTDGLFASPLIDRPAPQDNGDEPELRTVHPVALGAASSGDAGVLTLLAEYGADLNVIDSRGRDLIEVAVERANNLVIPELLGFGFDPDTADAQGRTLLMRSMLCTTDTSRLRNRFRGHAPTARALIEGGADVSQTDNEGRTALHYAAGSSVPDLVTLLLDAGADPLAKDNEGRLPSDYTKADAPRIERYAIDATARANNSTILLRAVARARAAKDAE